MAWLSIAGLYYYDNTLFDSMTIPDGVDKETLVYTLLSELAELECIYPDPNFMKTAISMWSRKNINAWNKIYKTTTIEYNPIENYDRIETFNDSGKAISRVAAFNESELVPSGDGETKTERSGRIHGNIGVTTTQEMLEAERKVSTFTIYDHICADFKTRFCVMVY